MQKSSPRARLLAALAIASLCAACGSVRSGTADLPVAGSSNGGSSGSETDGPGLTGGSGGLPGGSPSVGGSTASEGGSAIPGGSGGLAGTAGAGGGTGGADDGSAGAGTGGAGGEPDKIILFDGSKESFNNWSSVRKVGVNPWRDNGDGTMTSLGGTGSIQSKQAFRNVFVHLEYMIPKVSAQGASQANSGALLNGSYELQISALEAFDLEPTEATCGAVYGLTAPLEIACFAEELWNLYEIEFQAPLCDNDAKTLVTPARFLDVKLNGRLIHRNVDVLQKTTAGQDETCEPRGLLLQEQFSILPVSFRNIWAIPRD